VLVVDDCHDHLQAMSMALGDLGYEVRLASNGELALAQMTEFVPDCVLFDINMPVMNGYELAQTLKTYAVEQTVLIGMSGASSNEPFIAGAAPLVDRWFNKPIDLDDLESYLTQLSRGKPPR
jgi:two-component system, NarL family, capsular synthesis sensor histidine kinase RcsC